MNVDNRIRSFKTALGACGIGWSELGVAAVILPGDRALVDAAAIEPDDAPEPIGEAIAGIVALLEGERRDLRAIALDERRLDDFRRRVYAATRELGPGETASYGSIAKAIGEPEPRAAREVGAALGENPFPIIVPCHRVLAVDGSLRGFSAPGGIGTKRRMLEIEGAPGFTQQALFAA